jgi:hypothetical protein
VVHAMVSLFNKFLVNNAGLDANRANAQRQIIVIRYATKSTAS